MKDCLERRIELSVTVVINNIYIYIYILYIFLL